MKNLIVCCSLVIVLSGCTVPRAAFKSSVVNESNDKYTLTEMAHHVKKERRDEVSFPAPFYGAQSWSWESLTAGDVLHITILSSGGAEYLSSESGGSRMDFENILVGTDNHISIPYAGRLSVQGFDTHQLAAQIQSRLSRVILNPQVLVTLISREAAMVTLQGGSGNTGRFPIDQSMNRLNHLLSGTLPESYNAEMTEIRMTRNHEVLRINLSDFNEKPELDLPLQPGDLVNIVPRSEFINVLGAVGEQGKYSLLKRDSTLLDALAIAKGMNDSLADPRAVFLFKHDEAVSAEQAHRKPVIYHIDMSQPESVFVAKTTPVDDGDVIYISNASLTDFAKVRTAIDFFLLGGRSAF